MTKKKRLLILQSLVCCWYQSWFSRKKVWVNLGFYAVSFTLNQLSYILIVFVLSCTFWKKVRKTSAHGKNRCLRRNLAALVVKHSSKLGVLLAGTSIRKCPLFTPHTVSPQSGTCSSLRAFAMQNLGCTRHNISKLIFCSHLHEISLVFRVLRNLICTAIQGKLYPCKSSNSPHTMA